MIPYRAGKMPPPAGAETPVELRALRFAKEWVREAGEVEHPGCCPEFDDAVADLLPLVAEHVGSADGLTHTLLYGEASRATAHSDTDGTESVTRHVLMAFTVVGDPAGTDAFLSDGEATSAFARSLIEAGLAARGSVLTVAPRALPLNAASLLTPSRTGALTRAMASLRDGDGHADLRDAIASVTSADGDAGLPGTVLVLRTLRISAIRHTGLIRTDPPRVDGLSPFAPCNRR